MKITPPLKYHGGKHFLAPKIVALMPPHTHYSEPYFGGGSVLLAKDPEGVSEAVNDLDGGLMNFWRVLQSGRTFNNFVRSVEAIPFSEESWRDPGGECIGTDMDDCTACAVAFFVRCRQSMAGRGGTFSPLSISRTRRGMNEQCSAWLNAVEGLPAVHARLKRVAITCRSALDCIRQQDGPATMFYLDPPYLHETRSSSARYGVEMDREDHEKLLTTLKDVRGKFILSGYMSNLYSCASHNYIWNLHKFSVPNNAGSGKVKNIVEECLWTNF